MSPNVLLLNADGNPISISPLSTVSWKVAIRMVFQGKVIVLKEYNDLTVRSQYLDMKVPSIVMSTDHIKWNKRVNYNRTNIYIRDNFTCQLQITHACKSAKGQVDADQLTIDHVVPKSHGGKSTWTNVCTSCKTCNSAKGSDHTILPKIAPRKPTYYELLNRRKSHPITIHDPEWAAYIGWPHHLITLAPVQRGFAK